MAAELGLIKVLNLPQSFCFQGSAADIIQQIAAALAVDLPDTITNVYVGPNAPVNPQDTAIWVRQDNSGLFLGLYVVSNGQFVLAVGNWQEWDPTYSAGGAMTYSITSEFLKEYWTAGDTVGISLSVEGTTGGVADPELRFTLPLPAASVQQIFTVTTNDNAGIHVVGTGRVIGAQTVGIRKFDNTNWGIGVLRGFRVSGTYKRA